MSTAPYYGQLQRDGLALVPPAAKTHSGGPTRRRGTLQQGHALELLGHAVEYLIDSGLYDQEGRNPDNDRQSVRLLMSLSRSVFADCPEVPTLRQRAHRLFERMLGSR